MSVPDPESEYLSEAEVQAMDKAVADFILEVETCALSADTITLPLSTAQLLLSEIRRLQDVEGRYEDTCSAAEDQ